MSKCRQIFTSTSITGGSFTFFSPKTWILNEAILMASFGLAGGALLNASLVINWLTASLSFSFVSGLMFLNAYKPSPTRTTPIISAENFFTGVAMVSGEASIAAELRERADFHLTRPQE